MKKLLTNVLFLCMLFPAYLTYAQSDITLIPTTYQVAETKPTPDGNLISIGYSNDFPLEYDLTKHNFDGDIIWSQGYNNPIGYSDLHDIFPLNDGGYALFNNNYYNKFNSAGELLSTIEYSAEILGYAPIPGDDGIVQFEDVVKLDIGFIYLVSMFDDGTNYFAIAKLDEDGNSLWSYAYSYDDYAYFSCVAEGDFVYVTAGRYDVDYSYNMIKISQTDGSIISETLTDDLFYNTEMIKVTDGVIETGTVYNIMERGDMLVKYNFEGDTLWTSKIYYTGMDSGYVIETISLESDMVVTLSSFSPYDVPAEYVLTYYDTDGDTIFSVHDFLDYTQYQIVDMERKEDQLLFSGTHHALGEEIGFVLITDTLGAFEKLLIQGKVFYDENDNGILDEDEYAFHDRLITTDPPGNYAFTNMDGEYKMYIYEPGSYTLTTENPEYWDVMDPLMYSVTFDPALEDTISDQNFHLDYTIPVLDLRATIYQLAIAPGFYNASCVTVENVGNQTAIDATVRLHYPAGLIYDDGTPFTDHTDTIITWELTDINPTYSERLHAHFTASEDLVIDDIKLTVATIDPMIGDAFIENNTDSVYNTVVSAFDPNHKTVDPAGLGEEGYIDPNTEWLEYTIQFQNVGTAPATFVNIDDVIDSHLDVNSIQILGSEHNYWMELSADNTITWHFDDINLPDSASDPLGSCGYVKYMIKIKEDAAVGTVITNTAYIYFDYNDAVITNTTKTTLELPNYIPEINKVLNIYPNPAGDHIIIQLEEENTSGFDIKVYNTNGEAVFKERLDAGKQMVQINSSSYPNGIYFINCSDDEGILKTNAKFIVAH